MNDTASSPSRLLKITAVTARWLLGLLIAAWLVLALSVVVLHAWIVPRIGDYRGLLEAQASKVIGVPVRIGSITARSGSLFPAFELRDVVLLDAERREALRLARVVASVSPRSLWRLNFEQIYIEGPQVDVRRDAEGRLHVAGLPMEGGPAGETRGIDWFFAQREFVVEGGTVRWTDEQREAEPLVLTGVRFVARNGGRGHALRFDATPPPGWGEPFTLRARFRQPLLSVRTGHWQTWDGQIYADLPYFDVTQLGRHVDLDARIRQGSGALRAWADVKDGKLVGGAADLGLARIDASLGQDLQPLVLQGVTGRIAGQLRDDQTLEFSTTALQFDTADGMRWPGGNLWLQHTPAGSRAPERGALRADRLDLGALALIADRLPLGDATHRELGALAPRGLVEQIDLSWQGSLGAPDKYQVRGRVSGLSIASQPAAAVETAGPTGVAASSPPAAAPARTAPATQQPQPTRAHPGVPGLRGLTADFDASQNGGTASLSIDQGAVDFPGLFAEPTIPLDQFSAQLQWKLDGARAQLQASKLHFANADAEGEATLAWHTADQAGAGNGNGAERFPGVLDLRGNLTRADGTRVFRYLPLDVPQETRDYLQHAVTKGSASSVEFRVRGNLLDMPFIDPRRGEFRIAAKVADVDYAYVPSIPGVSHPPRPGAVPPQAWPALTGLSGELVFERAGMQVRNAHGRLVGAPGIEVSKTSAQIPDMWHRGATLRVDAQARGPLDELLKVGAPLAGNAGDVLRQARAVGVADYRLRLDLPFENVDATKVQASIALAGNELQPVPEAPPFTQARGTLNFTESGFSLAGVQARLLGGDVRVEGRGRFGGSAGHDELSFRALGTATAEGLRDAHQVDWLARLATKASGSTPYEAAFSLRDGATEFAVTSSLQGVALQLPEPMAKAAEAQMPLRIEKKVVLRETRGAAGPVAVQDQLTMDLGRVGSAQYLRDISGPEPRVLRGSIGVGLAEGESAGVPDRGVLANINVANLDLPAWQAIFSETTGSPPEALAEADQTGDAQAYLPTRIAVRARQLGIGGRTLHNVVLGGTREGVLWRANVDATELSGYAEYRHTQAGRLYARLARLKIAPSEATQVETLLDEQPGTLPALDIVIDDFELLGRRLGRAEIDAVNRGGAGHEWQLDKLSFTTPEASFSAKGSWAAIPGSGGSASRPAGGPEQRRTAMSFRLDVSDAGELLGRFGMPGVLRRGSGRLEGEVNWRGSPFALDYPSLGGQLHVDVVSGQFLQADPGLAKLLGVLSLQALPRRLALDFRDVFSQGFAFDFVRGDARINDGIASTNNLQMKGVNAGALMDGSADIVRETQDLHVVVVPEINAGTAALVATAINPAIGLGTFLAQWVLSKPLAAAATQEFHIEGTWADPKISKVARPLLPAALGLPLPSPHPDARQ